MNPVSLLFGLPLAPLRGLVRLAELIQEQAEMELRHPAAVRRRLEEVAEARAAGLISAEEEAEETERILREMIT
ncbi:rubrerythrin [Streptosporangium becharense]|uniref:Rubrerythrin n=1 Tax=Streptosporangium becharense TaxID=1816182 RepID=A0A7W9IKS8_9ACTN|nr:gas vesicle protein GvpG [Streptosporangium becharense]MBB2911609.1 rubrerythrin [Streptosporangium becharense]MBB5822573.1 rubrerythrin [Streptosporangium becharense]